MIQKKILHVCYLDKFIAPFIEIIENNFDVKYHIFFTTGDKNKYPIKIHSNVIHIDSKRQYFALSKAMFNAEKIILHSIFEKDIVWLLATQPWLLKKCYWCVWGGDLYHFQHRINNPEENRFEKVRAFIIKRFGHLITYVKGDYELAKKWYHFHGEYHECLMYRSNIFNNPSIININHKQTNILIGNSADPTNNHIEILEKLISYKDCDIKIYCPLSYGQRANAKKISELGIKLFGSKFYPLTEFITFDQYIKLLNTIDVAIFAHKRQQAMGNIISLLGLGKKVFMRSDITSWIVFEHLGITTYDLKELDIQRIDDATRNRNQTKIKAHFSEQTLVKQLRDIFEG